MNITIDINDYCKNPINYTYLPPQTRKYYDHICQLRNTINKDWEEQLKKLGIAITSFPGEFIMSIFTPSGLEMMSIFMGIDLSSKLALNGILRGIARGVSADVMDLATELAAEEGALFVNNAILTTVLADSVEEGTLAATAFMITTTIAESISTIISIITIVQILGSIIDSWDPEGFGNELNAETLDIINREFDNEFISHFLSVVTVGNDRFGRPEHLTSWPVTYHIDSLLAQSGKKNQTKLFDYVFEYLSALKFNSNGEPLFPRQKGGELINPNLEKHADQISLLISNQNTVVAKWVRNNFLIIIIFAIFILIAIYFLRNKKLLR